MVGCLITKFPKIVCHKKLELYGIYSRYLILLQHTCTFMGHISGQVPTTVLASASDTFLVISEGGREEGDGDP